MGTEKMRIKRIKVAQRAPVFIIEKREANDIPEGSRIYCGCCGHIVGTAKQKIRQPFILREFLQSIGTSEFVGRPSGVYHGLCGQRLVENNIPFKLVEMDDYLQKMIPRRKFCEPMPPTILPNCAVPDGWREKANEDQFDFQLRQLLYEAWKEPPFSK